MNRSNQLAAESPAGAVTNRAVRLVCLDFDGTIMCYDESPGFFHPKVVERLNDLERHGVAWCTNSGRDFDDQRRVLDASMHLGLRHKPIALLCSEALVYERRNGSYVPAEPWNSRAYEGLRSLQVEVQARLLPELERLSRAHRNATYFIGEHYLAFNVENGGGWPEKLQAELERLLEGIDGCRISRNGGWVAVIHVSLGKGAILREFARRAGFRLDEILAVGDHLNDLDMLNGRAARWVGCPANSAPEIVAAVRAAGGHVANAEGPLGTVEVIRRFVEPRNR